MKGKQEDSEMYEMVDLKRWLQVLILTGNFLISLTKIPDCTEIFQRSLRIWRHVVVVSLARLGALSLSAALGSELC